MEMKLDFEESLFYQIHASEKFFHMLFDQFFKELNLGVNAKEHLALIIIKDTTNCCQRDLARIIFQDRANSGKLALSLQKKGLIEIELKTKNNRPVRILSITNKGLEVLKKTKEACEPIHRKIIDTISYEVLEQTKQNLKDFRETVKDVMKVKI